MTHNGIAVPSTTEIDDREQLAAIVQGVLETAQNIVVHERDQQNGHNLGGEVDLSPLLDLEDNDSHTLAELASILSALDPEDDWQHDDWEPGDPCPECGTDRISVIEPREYYYTYDEQGDVVQTSYGDVSGPEMNHYCKECDILLSEHPATSLFWLQ
jgi:hypothetical protein